MEKFALLTIERVEVFDKHLDAFEQFNAAEYPKAVCGIFGTSLVGINLSVGDFDSGESAFNLEMLRRSATRSGYNYVMAL